MKILITGGCGFLGSNLSQYFLSLNYEVHVLDNLTREGGSNNLEWLRNNGLTYFYKYDITNFALIQDLICDLKPDIIIHLAGQVAMSKSIENPIFDFLTNTYSTINILESIRLHSKNTKLIYSSTNKIYGTLDQFNYTTSQTRYICTDYPRGFDENTPIFFQSPYGCSKGSADLYVLDYSKQYNLKCSVFRHSSIYGARQFSTFDQGWVCWFIKQAKNNYDTNNHAVSILGNGLQVRDLLYISDAVNLYNLAIHNFNSINGNYYNIGGGIENSLSIIELLLYLDKFYNVKSNLIKNKFRSGDQKVFVSNNDKIYQSLSWKPIVNVYDGLTDSINWINTIS